MSSLTSPPPPPPPAPPPPSAPRLSLLRDRSFALLLAGETISGVGTAVTVVAFPLVAIAVLHATAFQVGVITAASNAAWLVVALPAGAVADRVRRRPILIGTDLGRAALLASVPLAWALHVLSIGQLIAVAFLVGIGSVIFEVAYPAFLPSVIPSHRLVEGNGILEASTNSAYVAGPGIGGLLVRLVGAPVTLLADAVSYLVSAAAVFAIRVDEPRHQRRSPEPGRPRHPTARMLGEIVEGLKYVTRHRMTGILTASVTAANFVFGGYLAVVVVFLARQLALSADVIGVLFAIGAVGGIAGALLAGPMARRIGDARVLWLSAALNTPALLLVPMATRGAGLAWFVVGQIAINIAVAAFNVCARAAIQQSAPSSMLGRVTASIRVFSRGALPIGSLVGGALASVYTPRVALFAMLALYVFVPLRLFFSPIGQVREVAELSAASTLVGGETSGDATSFGELTLEHQHADAPGGGRGEG